MPDKDFFIYATVIITFILALKNLISWFIKVINGYLKLDNKVKYKIQGISSIFAMFILFAYACYKTYSYNGVNAYAFALWLSTCFFFVIMAIILVIISFLTKNILSLILDMSKIISSLQDAIIMIASGPSACKKIFKK